MKRFILNLVILPFLIILFSQCKKEILQSEEIGEKIGEIKLNNSELNIIPYQINDSLTFKDSLGNSQIYIVDSRLTHLSRYYKDGGTDSRTDYYDIENLSVSIKNNNGDYFKLHLDAPLPSYVSNNHINKNYFIVSSYSLSSDNYFSFPNYIDTTNFYYSINGISIPYHPNFNILNQTFNSVYELTENSTKIIYYNTSDGIIGFKNENNAIWYLDN